ncbi:potassium channel, subfamily K, member 16-like [Diadema setosum]|uniref:potassium channel, subfamily K, member 16-like n=1 Tax=Diadema setosum TaxID=31175 RepID=UPI003B3AEEAC
MGPWAKSCILLFILVVYLFAGAFVFRHLERPIAVSNAERFTEALKQLIEDYDCIGEADVHELMDIVTRAIGEGGFDADRAIDVVMDGGISNQTVIASTWSFEPAYVFTFSIVTTVGFGNLAPRTNFGQVFCVLFAVIGIPLAGGLMFSIGELLKATWRRYVKTVHRVSEKMYASIISRVVTIISFITLTYSIMVLVPSVLYHFTQDWTYTEAHYYAVIALTTVGLGDFVPNNDYQGSSANKWSLRVIMCVYFFAVIGALSTIISQVVKKQQRATNSISRTVEQAMRVRVPRVRHGNRKSPKCNDEMLTKRPKDGAKSNELEKGDAGTPGSSKGTDERKGRHRQQLRMTVNSTIAEESNEAASDTSAHTDNYTTQEIPLEGGAINEDVEGTSGINFTEIV